MPEPFQPGTAEDRTRPLRIFVDWNPSGPALERLRAGTAGHALVLSRRPGASALEAAPPDPRMEEAEVVFGQPDPIALGRAGRLRWVHISSSGVTRYDTPGFRARMARRGVRVTHSPTVYCEPCADHALCFLLAQSRQLPRALASRAAGGDAAWDLLRAETVPLRGQRLLILGFGAIGRKLAERLLPLGLRVSGFRRAPRGDEPVEIVGPGGLDAALAAADHAVNILPETPETRGFFHADRFAAMRPGAVFYNIGRGATVDQDALLGALRSGRLQAAWLDVTVPEPLPADHPLRAEPRCHITPHVAGGFAGEEEALVLHFLGNLERLARGEPLRDQMI